MVRRSRSFSPIHSRERFIYVRIFVTQTKCTSPCCPGPDNQCQHGEKRSVRGDLNSDPVVIPVSDLNLMVNGYVDLDLSHLSSLILD